MSEELTPSRKVEIEENQLYRLASHGIHFSNCDIAEWKEDLKHCKCGLFDLIDELNLDKEKLFSISHKIIDNIFLNEQYKSNY